MCIRRNYIGSHRDFNMQRQCSMIQDEKDSSPIRSDVDFPEWKSAFMCSVRISSNLDKENLSCIENEILSVITSKYASMQIM